MCDYGLDEVRRRIGRLFIPSKNSKLRVEEIERLFDLPEMTTAYDDPREAEYIMKVSGLGGWKLTVQRAGRLLSHQSWAAKVRTGASST